MARCWAVIVASGWLATTTFGPAAMAQEPTPRAERAPTQEEETEAPATEAEWDVDIIYVRPGRSRPERRVSGGVRGPKRREMILIAPPDHAGMAATPQPTLYWYVGEATDVPVELVIQERGAVKPLVNRTLPSPAAPGYQAISLRQIGVKLRQGVEYEWWVALVNDRERRSRDGAVGWARVVYEPPERPATQFRTRRRSDRAVLYAGASYWYDAIETIAREIETYPHLEGPRRQRQLLGRQVKLELPLR